MSKTRSRRKGENICGLMEMGEERKRLQIASNSIAVTTKHVVCVSSNLNVWERRDLHTHTSTLTLSASSQSSRERRWCLLRCRRTLRWLKKWLGRESIHLIPKTDLTRGEKDTRSEPRGETDWYEFCRQIVSLSFCVTCKIIISHPLHHGYGLLLRLAKTKRGRKDGRRPGRKDLKKCWYRRKSLSLPFLTSSS